jgi:endonuclease-3
VPRICNRAGWTETANPDKTESALREILPRKYWQKINALLVLYVQQICRPISPWCSRCVIADHCAKRGLDKVR